MEPCLLHPNPYNPRLQSNPPGVSISIFRLIIRPNAFFRPVIVRWLLFVHNKRGSPARRQPPHTPGFRTSIRFVSRSQSCRMCPIITTSALGIGWSKKLPGWNFTRADSPFSAT